MTILFCGGEYNDFPDRTNTLYQMNGVYLDTNFARMSMQFSNAFLYIKSPVVTPFTSVWLSFINRFTVSSSINMYMGLGFCKSGSDAFLGLASGPVGDVRVIKYDGTTKTLLGTLYNKAITDKYVKYDMQVINYGGSGTINIYIDSKLQFSYTGDLTSDGQTTLDQVIFTTEHASFFIYNVSEIILADEDTRLMRLKTLAPNAAGDVNDWNNDYTYIDEAVINDLDIIYTDAGANDFQCNVTGMPVGSFDVKAVKVSSRVSQATGSLGIKTGIKTNSALHLGSIQNPDSSWNEYQEIYQVNPETTNPFTPAEIDALQLALQSQT